MTAPVSTRNLRRTSRILRREPVLLILLFVVIAVNTWLSPYFLDFYNLADSTFNFSEKAMIALPMALLIICRQIDLSVASIVAIASTVIGLMHQSGAPPLVLAASGIATGAVAGMVNGALITWFAVPAIVVTIGTLSLFRGISYVILGDQAVTGYSADFSILGQGYLWGLPIEFYVLIVLTLLFGFVLHFTVFGRRIFAIGHNAAAARFAGVPVDHYHFVIFAVTGAVAGLAAVFLTSRIGSTRPNIAVGWELEIITMVVLGGVRIEGGQGSILGVFLAVMVLGMLNFGLQLVNVPGIVLNIFVGTLMVLVVAIPKLMERFVGKPHRTAHSLAVDRWGVNLP